MLSLAILRRWGRSQRLEGQYGVSMLHVIRNQPAYCCTVPKAVANRARH